MRQTTEEKAQEIKLYFRILGPCVRTTLTQREFKLLCLKMAKHKYSELALLEGVSSNRVRQIIARAERKCSYKVKKLIKICKSLSIAARNIEDVIKKGR